MGLSTKTAGTILVVDDSPDARTLYMRALAMENYSVHEASNGHEAFEKMENTLCPDLILLDLSMPQMDGAEFIERLREHPTCSKTKVVIVSGWDNLSARAKDLGAAGSIRKPVDLLDLYKEVGRHFGA